MQKNFSLQQDLIDKIDKVAELEKRDKSTIVSAALERYFNRSFEILLSENVKTRLFEAASVKGYTIDKVIEDALSIYLDDMP